jgi:hypothetical protein
MYNTQFKVKYHDIEQELLAKIVSMETEAGADHDASTSIYSADDVVEVCSKLYRDEITSVFNADNIMDDKIDMGMKTVMAKMMENADFSSCVQDIKTYLQEHIMDSQFSADDLDDDAANCMIYLTLFSKPVFHLAHKCICQHLSGGQIDKYLIDELKELLKNNA